MAELFRLIALAYDPYLIVYANAAFIRLSGLPSEKIIGSGFASIADRRNEEGEAKPVVLTDCMMSSESGNHPKLQLVHDGDKKDDKAPVQCYAKVLPIVSKRPLHGFEPSKVSHFAVELLGDTGSGIVSSSSLGSSASGTMLTTIKLPSVVQATGDAAVGVMG